MSTTQPYKQKNDFYFFIVLIKCPHFSIYDFFEEITHYNMKNSTEKKYRRIYNVNKHRKKGSIDEQGENKIFVDIHNSCPCNNCSIDSKQ